MILRTCGAANAIWFLFPGGCAATCCSEHAFWMDAFGSVGDGRGRGEMCRPPSREAWAKCVTEHRRADCTRASTSTVLTSHPQHFDTPTTYHASIAQPQPIQSLLHAFPNAKTPC